MSKASPKIPGDQSNVRCAIYTRKSTEEGPQQEFNTLDAQRESAEAYIAAQKHEGWVCLPDRYDDGGFTGGNLDRPAVQRLMKDIDAGKVDCVVVYKKVDRLSRSLMDFAKMMETFDRHKVSFVSVTQQFNTTHSMGRLTLNILLSFAQFEREIISERTRDKIAAARRKGKFAGGRPVLGYDLLSNPTGPKLIVNDLEANQVRAIFEIYLKHQALIPTVRELDERGWTTKVWQTKDGKKVGGCPFDKNLLYHLLTNVVYLGKVRHHDGVFFRRLVKRKNRNVAMMAVARKIVSIAVSMLQRNEPYRYAVPGLIHEKLTHLRSTATGKRTTCRHGMKPQDLPAVCEHHGLAMCSRPGPSATFRTPPSWMVQGPSNLSA